MTLACPRCGNPCIAPSPAGDPASGDDGGRMSASWLAVHWKALAPSIVRQAKDEVPAC